MPSRSQLHVDRALTNISVQYMQDTSAFIADKVFPTVPVVKQSDRYFKYLKEDWFRDDAAERAMGTESAGGDYTIDNTPTYFCKKYAFHKDVFEEDRANSDDPLQPDQDATEFVVSKVLLNKENNWANNYFKAGIWSTDMTGSTTKTTTTVIKWSDYANSEPVKDVDDLSRAIQETTGKRPNTMVLGRAVYDALRQHPEILDRIKYTQTGVITDQLLASLFDVERILVANAIQNTAKKGQDAKMEFIMGKHMLLCYAEKRPRLKAASAGYCFTWTGLLGSNALGGRINRIPMPSLGIGTERIECELAYDMKVVAADLGAFISGVVD